MRQPHQNGPLTLRFPHSGRSRPAAVRACGSPPLWVPGRVRGTLHLSRASARPRTRGPRNHRATPGRLPFEACWSSRTLVKRAPAVPQGVFGPLTGRFEDWHASPGSEVQGRPGKRPLCGHGETAAMGTRQLERQAVAATRHVHRTIGTEIGRLRADGGISQRRLAVAAGVDQSFLARIESGGARPTIETLSRLAAALGADLNVRLYPNTGPPIRDRHQARMIEALLRVLHPRWHSTLEVAVRSPARGIIDLVLHDPVAGIALAVEAQSELRRVEQQLRWSGEKAASLPSSALWSTIRTREPRIGRVLLLRSTRTMRTLVADLEKTFRVAYPADHAAARRALTTPDEPWPGSGIVWVSVDGREAAVLERRPAAARRPGSAPGGLAESSKDRD